MIQAFRILTVSLCAPNKIDRFLVVQRPEADNGDHGCNQHDSEQNRSSEHERQCCVTTTRLVHDPEHESDDEETSDVHQNT